MAHGSIVAGSSPSVRDANDRAGTKYTRASKAVNIRSVPSNDRNSSRTTRTNRPGWSTCCAAAQRGWTPLHASRSSPTGSVATCRRWPGGATSSTSVTDPHARRACAGVRVLLSWRRIWRRRCRVCMRAAGCANRQTFAQDSRQVSSRACLHAPRHKRRAAPSPQPPI